MWLLHTSALPPRAAGDSSCFACSSMWAEAGGAWGGSAVGRVGSECGRLGRRAWIYRQPQQWVKWVSGQWWESPVHTTRQPSVDQGLGSQPIGMHAATTGPPLRSCHGTWRHFIRAGSIPTTTRYPAAGLHAACNQGRLGLTGQNSKAWRIVLIVICLWRSGYCQMKKPFGNIFCKNADHDVFWEV